MKGRGRRKKKTSPTGFNGRERRKEKNGVPTLREFLFGRVNLLTLFAKFVDERGQGRCSLLSCKSFLFFFFLLRSKVFLWSDYISRCDAHPPCCFCWYLSHHCWCDSRQNTLEVRAYNLSRRPPVYWKLCHWFRFAFFLFFNFPLIHVITSIWLHIVILIGYVRATFYFPFSCLHRWVTSSAWNWKLSGKEKKRKTNKMIKKRKEKGNTCIPFVKQTVETDTRVVFMFVIIHFFLLNNYSFGRGAAKDSENVATVKTKTTWHWERTRKSMEVFCCIS